MTGDRQQDIERLAKGMGWHRHPEYPVWVDEDGGFAANESFDPWESWYYAGMVWDAMMQKGYQPCVNWLDGAGIQPTGYHASFFFPETRTFYDAYGCDAAPAAIAEAALKVWDGL